MAMQISDSNFEEVKTSAGEKPLVIDFWATWCGPCRMLAPTISRIAEEQEGKVKVCKLDVDEVPEIAAKYGISSIPTLKFFKKGTVVGTSVGVQPKAAIESMLK